VIENSLKNRAHVVDYDTDSIPSKTDEIICSQLIGKAENRNTLFLETGDTEKRYKKNCKRLGTDWYYYNKKLSYNNNCNGFRTKEFKDIDWANSIVVFGDSYTMGEGNTIEDVYTSVLQDMIGIPVVNLGIGGAGVDRSCWNSLALHENYPRPKAIINLWSSLDRYSEYNYKLNYWDDYKPGRKGYCLRNHYWYLRNIFCVKTDRALWRDKVPYIEAAIFKDTAEKLQVYPAEIIDFGRDEDHWGPKSNVLMAEYFYERLKESGVA